VEGFDVYEAIKSCAHLLEQFGGHKYAAGLTLPIENVTAFQKQFELEVSKNITTDQLVPKIKIDQEIDFKDIDFKLLNLLKQMGPFGPFNMQPVFVTKNVVLKKEVRLLKYLHLKLLVNQENEATTLDAIGFNLGQFAEKLHQPFNMAYTIEENNFMGNKSIQLNLKDIQIND
jgi:single-stranded-DNA-specific exonuclease